MLLLALALAASAATDEGSTIESEFDRIEARSNAKLTALSAQYGFPAAGGLKLEGPSSFAQTADVIAGSDEDLANLMGRLKDLRSKTASKLQQTQGELAQLPKSSPGSSFLEEQSKEDASFAQLDAELAKMHSEEEAKIQDLFPHHDAPTPSSFVETGEPSPLGEFGTPAYRGPSSASLLKELAEDDRVEKTRQESYARQMKTEDAALAKADHLKEVAAGFNKEAAASSLAELWDDSAGPDNAAYNKFADKMKDITDRAHQSISDMRNQEERQTAEKDEELEDQEVKAQQELDHLPAPEPAWPSSLLETEGGKTQRNFQDLERKLAALEERSRANWAGSPRASSLLEEGVQSAAASGQAVALDAVHQSLQEVYAGVNQSMAAIHKHLVDSGELPVGELASSALELAKTPIADKFRDFTSKFQQLSKRVGKDLARQSQEIAQAKGSLSKFEASSFVETAALGRPVTFKSLESRLHAIKAESMREIDRFPESLLERQAALDAARTGSYVAPRHQGAEHLRKA